MQDKITDRLASKRIPASSRLAALPRLIAGRLVPAISHGTRNSLTTQATPASKTAERGFKPTSSLQTYIYTGSMNITGSLSADSGQKGSWSGTLTDTLTVYMDSAGNGFASEDFTGSLHLHVSNPDGTTGDETSPFNFSVPSLQITGGSFSTSQPSYGLGGNLIATLTLKGSFGTTPAIITEAMHIPFAGFVNGVGVSGSVNGTSGLSTPAMGFSGAQSQATTAGKAATPFENIAIKDLHGVPVSVMIKLSNPENGVLTNLGTGRYYRAAGLYEATGAIAQINSDIDGLSFTPAGDAGQYGQPLVTRFTINISDSKGGSLQNSDTTVSAVQQLSLTGTRSGQTAMVKKVSTPFRFIQIRDASSSIDEVRVKMSNPTAGTFSNLGTGKYYQKSGLYVVDATASQAAYLLSQLKFTPTSAGTISFTISVKNANGDYLNNTATTVKAATAGAATLFNQYIATGLKSAAAYAAGITAVHEVNMANHIALAPSHA